MEKVWAGEKFKALPAERQKEIAERVERGMNEAQARFVGRVKRRAALKAGRKFLVDNEIDVLQMNMNGYRVMAAVQDTGGPAVRIAYAICSPKDSFSEKVGRGMVGMRLGATKDYYIQKAPDLEEISIEEAKIKVLTVLQKRSDTPHKMFKNFLQ